MFTKILIANRGEIACRVIRTARRLGIATVAVHSEADAAARHVLLADEAVEIGPAPVRDSYLRGDRIIAAAQRTGAAAVHPGYGLLSENAEFAADCAAAGLVFVGPGAAAIRAMGRKDAARALIENAGIPVVPGYHGDDQSDGRLRAEADRIGYPVLLKPSAGGGGKGMRVVRAAARVDAALASARREASAAFGDTHMLIEKFVAEPRHIEVQVFADAHGNVLHLFERDCSVQRRHQKVIEEAPAPGLTGRQRLTLGQAAVDAAKAVGYLGAGTVEFLVDSGGGFYFMEMNTRLQVEHPVTELVTGQDLVEWQLLVAAGEPLPLSQGDLAINGHAIEARLYAEDPDRDFLPATGRLLHLRYPAAGQHVRIDTGVREGDPVGIHYDPLLAKLIAWDADRAGALRRLRTALRATQVVGVTTNLGFLAAVAAHGAFAAGGVDTGFVDRHRGDLAGVGRPPWDGALVVAALDVMLRREARARSAAAVSGDPDSPWHSSSGWRLNASGTQALHFVADGAGQRVTVECGRGAYQVRTPAGLTRAAGHYDAGGDLAATLDGCRLRVTVVRQGDVITILHQGAQYRIEHVDPARRADSETAAAGGLTAPMPGRVALVSVSAGDSVRRGDTLLIIEAMKMEHSIIAPSDGVVERLRHGEGELVDEGAELLVLRPAGKPAGAAPASAPASPPPSPAGSRGGGGTRSGARGGRTGRRPGRSGG